MIPSVVALAEIFRCVSALLFCLPSRRNRRPMKSRMFHFGFLGLASVGLVLGIVLGISGNWGNQRSGPIVGNVRTFEAAYARWRAAAERNGQQTKLVLALGHFKGLSTRSTNARGSVVLDLTDGTLSVEVTGLPEREAFDVWLVHNQS